ncbi:DapH/DapD/GlmU-related protein [Arthrobacter sp. H5]|uniref:acyltransferase n=1 Tax=Arthrobacter sp. H5 TaxID=1267973 RepID=UPI0009DEA1EB|nr:DapH/DapD/GlmU-related protein [Arthrobacter sp. H5]
MIDNFKKRLLIRLGVRQNVSYGSNFHIGPGSIAWAPQHLSIGNDVYIGKNVTVQVDGTIGDHVLIANCVGIIGTTDHDISQVGVSVRESDWAGRETTRLSQPTTIGSDVWIGYGAIVLSGVTVGDSAIIGAGSIITKDVPPNSVVMGAPADFKRIRFTDEEFTEHWRALSVQGLRRL